MRSIYFWLMLVFFATNLIQTVNCVGGKYNISYEVLDKCKEYDAVIGYNYRHYFKLEEMDHNVYVNNNNEDENEILNLNIVVLGSKDALILLTPVDENQPNVPVYEIALGAGANTFCEIRKKPQRNALKTKRIQVLSPIDPVPITIKIKSIGLIEVFITGEVLPLISALDSNPIPNIKYISFSTWGAASVRFFYDCPDTKGQELTPQPRHLSTKDRLLQDLLNGYDMFRAPHHMEEVMMDTFTIKSVDYNEKQSVMTTRAQVVLSWNDSRLMWDPLDYENISTIRSPVMTSLWIPALMCINGINDAFKELDLQYIFTLHYDGLVTAESKTFEITTLCAASVKDAVHDWPATETGCYIQLMTQQVSLAGFDNSVKLDIDLETPWIVQSVYEDDDYVLNYLPFTEAYILANIGDTFVTPRMCIAYIIYIKQNQEYFRTIFRAPLFASIVLLTLATVTSKSLRYSLIGLSLIVLSLSIICLIQYTPVFYKPTIVIYHETLIYLSCASVLFAIINTWCLEYTFETIPPVWMSRIINFRWLRFSIGLGDTGNYDFLQEKTLEWQDINLVIDRIWFIVLVCLGTAIMCTC